MADPEKRVVSFVTQGRTDRPRLRSDIRFLGYCANRRGAKARFHPTYGHAGNIAPPIREIASIPEISVCFKIPID